jgi:hypothetical protein
LEANSSAPGFAADQIELQLSVEQLTPPNVRIGLVTTGQVQVVWPLTTSASVTTQGAP